MINKHFLQPLIINKFPLITLLLTLFCLNVKSINAQITPDSTLGNENSVVTPNMEINGKLADVIEGGATRGVNLFHSFSEFNIGEGGAAYFANPTVIQNIFSRVTGGNPSHIFGTLGVLGNANLFFINPSGIVFGNGASLDVRGTFVGSTASEIIFPDGNKFSATNPQGVPLLTIDVQPTVGLQIGEDSGNIINAGDLSTSTGQSIILVGNEVENNGSLTAPGGTVKLMGNEINLEGESVIDVSASEGGGVVMIGKGENGISTAESVSIGADVSIKADGLLEGNGGLVEIEAGEIVDFKGSISATGGVISGDGGRVVITAPEVVNQGSVDVTAINGNLGVVDISSNQGLEENQQETSATLVSSTETDVSEEEEDNDSVSSTSDNSPSSATSELAVSGEGEDNNSVSPANVNSPSSTTSELAVNGEGEDNNSVSSANINSPSSTTSESAVNGEGKDDNSVSSANVNSPSSVTQQSTVTSSSIVPDDSLGAESSEIEAIDESNDRVIGGAERGVNLFHSFLEFNIETGKGVYFANPEGINNIVTRVTGDNISEIRGTLGVEGSANLFFINPNGLFFNQNASLDLNGSFFASTAQAVIFNEFEYSVVNPNLPPNLVVSVPTGLRFGSNSGDLINQGTLISPNDLTLEAENLELSAIIAAEGNLTLKAQDTVTMRDSKENPFIAASGVYLLIQGNKIDIFALNHPHSGLFAGGDLILRSPNPVIGDAHYWSRGNFQIEDLEGNLGDLNSIEDPIIRATGDVSFNIYQGTSLHIIAGGSVNAGSISITTAETGTPGIDFIQEAITLTDGTVVNIDGSQQATVDIRAGVKSEAIGITGITGFEGLPIDFFADATFSFLEPPPSTNEPATSADITIGDIAIIPENGVVLLTNQYEPNLSLSGGDINILTSRGFLGLGIFPGIGTNANAEIDLVAIDARGNVNINGTIFASSFTNEGGDVIINSQEDISLTNGTITVTGNEGGNINLNAKNINVINSKIIGGIRAGLGFDGANSGDVIINASESIGIENSSIFNQVNPDAVGNSGGIVIDTTTLSLTNGGEISASTAGQGDAGAVQITATEGITLDGETSNGLAASRILSVVAGGAVGKGGGIIIDTTTLSLTNGGLISASTAGQGDAGAVQITASEGITLDGETSNGLAASGIFSTVQLYAVGNSGGIVIDTTKLSLTNGGEISASTLGQGDAGAVQVTASEGITLDGEKSNDLPSRILSQVNRNAVGNSGGIVIDPTKLSLTNGGEISASTLGQGDAGAVQVTASEGITLDGEKSNGLASGIFSQVDSDAEGNSGGIIIDTTKLSLTNGGEISASTLGQGDAGAVQVTAFEGITLDGEKSNDLPSRILSVVAGGAVGTSGGIVIDTTTLSLTNGGLISASTFGSGDAGAVQITASEGITLDGETRDGFPSRIVSQVNRNAVGNSGGIVIDTTKLSLTNGGAISASTLGQGDAGAVQVTASEGITLDGERNNGVPSVILSQVNRNAVGTSGGIVINTTTLSLTKGGTISASTFGSGDAGGVQVTASDSISLAGTFFDTFFDEILNRDIGGILAFTLTTGKAGDIIINTPQLTISEGSGIEAFTQGEGIAGNITINANESLILNTDTKLIVESSDVGTAGDININTPLLTIGENAQLSATATETSTSPTAGDITLNVSFLNIAGELGIFAETQSTPEAGSLTIQPYQTNPNLNIQFTGDGFISARTGENSGGDGGSITIAAPENIDIRGLGSITAETRGSGSAGNIDINTQNLTIAEQVTITTSTESSGNAGLITLNADESIFLTNEVKITSEVREGATGTSEGIVINTPILSISDRSTISAATEGEKKAGDITITASDSVTIDDKSLLNVQTDSIGEAGNIDITTNTLTIGEESELSAKTTINATGEAGTITINANFLDITGKLGIFAETDGIADAGSLNINPNDNLNLAITFDEGQISASTSNAGNGGDINIKATQTIDIQGNGTIKVETTGSGEAGDINFNSQQLNISEGVTISALTSGEGEAGSINLNIGEEITIYSGTTFTVETDGEKDAGNIELTANKITIGENAELSAVSKENAKGKAGDIILNTNQLTVFGDKGINAETLGDGFGGSITINPLDNNLTLEISFSNKGVISASTSGNGNAGNINLFAPNSINILGDGIIKVETSGSGDAGSIFIESNEINLTDGITLSASTSNIGDSQDITLTGNLINLDNATIEALTSGFGNPGSILISNGEISANQVNIVNDSTISTEIRGEGDRSSAQPANITINSENLSLTSSQITASTTSNRDAGNINLTGNNFNLDNGTIQALTEGEGNPGSILISNGDNQANQVNIVNDSTISTEINGEGDRNSAQPANITINSENLFLTSSQITASTTSNRDAGNINLTGNNFNLDNSNIQALTTGAGNAGSIKIGNRENNANQVSFTNSTTISTTVNSNENPENFEEANITINTDNLFLDNSTITAETESNNELREAGNINIPNTDNINLINNSKITASTDGNAKAGNINLSAPNIINISGDGIIQVETSGNGNAGSIFIQSNEINLTEGITVSASTSNLGNSQDITLTGNLINLDNATIQALTTNQGNPGNILISNGENSASQVNIINDSTISTEINGEGDRSSAQPANININSENLSLQSSQITASTNSNRNAGNITLETNQLTIFGDKGILADKGIFAETEGEGEGGNITIQPLNNNLSLEINFFDDGKISASTTNVGDGGNIEIINSPNLTISGKGKIAVETTGEGKAGIINLSTEELTLKQEVEVSASTFASGKSGDINLFADNINLDNASIQAITQGNGDGGNISIPDSQTLNLVNNSKIIALTQGEGIAGNINFNISQSVTIDSGSLLNVETQAGGKAGEITITSPILTIGDNAELSAVSKENATGIAGDITLNANQLNISGELGIFAETESIADAGNLTINSLENNPHLTIHFTTNQGNISASTFAGGNGGDINITADEKINISGDGIISVKTEGSGFAGTININTQNLNLTNGIEINASTFAEGNAGNINLFATNINLNQAEVNAITNSTGKAGNINFFADNINLDNALINALTTNKGDGGSINLPNSENLNLINQSEISASTSGEGIAGNIDLNVNQAVNVDSGSQLKVETESIGDAGDIFINTPTLTIGENAELSARSRKNATGEAGNITLNTNQLNISGELGIFAETEGEADAGNLTINPLENNPNLTINFTTNQGNISASTLGDGDGGDINITADENISISGDGIISVKTEGSGKAGSIFIDSNQINLTDGLEISASTSDSGDSNNITIEGNLINLDNATINAETSGLGNPGSILIGNGENNASEVYLTNNSTISTEINADGNIETQQPADITINADNLSLDTSKITASTSANRNAGKINILNTDNLNLNNNSEITAVTNSSGEGGNITITDGLNINLINNSKITASTNSSGFAGNINILNVDNLNLSNNSEINALTNSSGFAGNINILNADNLNLSNNSEINALTNSSGKAGNITINTRNLNFDNGATISAETTASGEGGNIDITNSANLTISGEGKIAVETTGDGKAGIIKFSAEELTLKDGVEVTASTVGSGDAGNINFNAHNINFNQAEINAFTNSTGNAGNILVNYQGENANNFTLTNSTISTEISENGVANKSSDITIQSDNLIMDNSTITASTSGKGNAGNITITNAEEINLNNSRILATTSGKGDTGEINLSATDKINLTNNSEINSSVETGGVGNSRQITINTPQLQLTQNSLISAETAGKGDAGQISIQNSNTVLIDENSTISTAIKVEGIAQQPANININTNTLTLDNNGEITASSAGRGDGGDITINTINPLTLDNQAKITSALDETGKGKGGNIIINSPSLFLDNQSEINASTFGIGEGGFVKLNIDNQVNLDNQSEIATAVEETAIGVGGIIEIDTQQVFLDNQSQLRASTLGEGDADSITINADTVELINGSKIRTETTSEFDAGNITLNLSESLFISDEGSGLFANTEENSRGDGGDINVNSPLINLENQGAIAVNSQGEGIGGNINIKANRLNLDKSNISAETVSTDGGNISLDIQETIVLRDHSNISATAGTAQAGGDGGNINITTSSILARPRENSDITANAFLGNGGNINITADTIFGLEERNQLTDLSDITASSEFGLDGNININTAGIDPVRGLEDLPETEVDTEIVIGCQPGSSKNRSSFKIPGKGGTSAKPDENIELDLLEWKPRIKQQNSSEKEEKINFLEYQKEEKWEKITTNQEMFLSEKLKFYWTDSCREK